MAYSFTLMLMSACEGSCRMCPFTTMSSNNAPSESRPLAMWVILRISPTNIQLHHRRLKGLNLLTLFTSKIIIFTILLTAHKQQVEPTMCIYINSSHCRNNTDTVRPVHSYLLQTPPVSLAWRRLLLACGRWQPLRLPAQWSSRQGSGLRWAFSLQDLEIKRQKKSAFHLLWDLLRKNNLGALVAWRQVLFGAHHIKF